MDIVYRDGETLVFCEVKTRTGTDYGRPALAVDKGKRYLIRKGAQHWLRALKHPVPYRYDIMEIILKDGERPKVNRIVHAFNDTD